MPVSITAALSDADAPRFFGSERAESKDNFLVPRTVIDHGEQAETAWTYVRLNLFLVRVPAFGVVSNFVDQERFVTHICQYG
jgi:hypothetical protein